MNFFTKQKLLLLPAFVIIFITGVSFYLYSGILKSAEEIIEDNKVISRNAVEKLVLEGTDHVTPIWEKYLKGKNKITKQDERLADSLISLDVEEVLSNLHRLEGGFYFYNLDAFIGYSFPTIANPKPAFGPPPRSYNIIRNQARSTIQSKLKITKLHEFDPAIFPLSTQPIYADGKLIGAAWARIHIERKLSASQHVQSGTFFLMLVGILLGLAITIIVVWTFRKNIKEIKTGLKKMKYNPYYRIKEYGGVLGVISRLINEMIDTQQEEQKKREKLEKTLFQKEKMATLGNLIAGTAHEINTPIAIIKTRIQIWERKLRKANSKNNSSSLMPDKSLKIIHTEIDRVSKLIKRLLLFSKPIGKEKMAVNIHTLLKEKMDWLVEAFPGHIITSITRFDPAMPPVAVDQESIEQVFINVLKNAVQASEEECEITVETKFLPNENLAQISVRDFGSGMPEDIKPKIFDPFFTTKNNGSGLGLSICNEIIKSHHGSIYFTKPLENNLILETWDQSTNIDTIRPNSGTICIIRLPVYM